MADRPYPTHSLQPPYYGLPPETIAAAKQQVRREAFFGAAVVIPATILIWLLT